MGIPSLGGCAMFGQSIDNAQGIAASSVVFTTRTHQPRYTNPPTPWTPHYCPPFYPNIPRANVLKAPSSSLWCVVESRFDRFEKPRVALDYNFESVVVGEISNPLTSQLVFGYRVLCLRTF